MTPQRITFNSDPASPLKRRQSLLIVPPAIAKVGLYSLVPKERHVRKEGNGSTLWLSNGRKESHDSTLEKNIVPKESHDCSFSLTCSKRE